MYVFLPRAEAVLGGAVGYFRSPNRRCQLHGRPVVEEIIPARAHGRTEYMRNRCMFVPRERRSSRVAPSETNAARNATNAPRRPLPPSLATSTAYLRRIFPPLSLGFATGVRDDRCGLLVNVRTRVQRQEGQTGLPHHPADGETPGRGRCGRVIRRPTAADAAGASHGSGS